MLAIDAESRSESGGPVEPIRFQFVLEDRVLPHTKAILARRFGVVKSGIAAHKSNFVKGHRRQLFY